MAIAKVVFNGTTWIDVTQDTVESAKLFSDYTATKNDGTSITGTYVAPTLRSAADLTASGSTVTVVSGYYSVDATKNVASATQATPGITVANSGLITATATQTAGYVAAGTKTSTSQLTSVAGTTITPTEASQLAVASARWTTGSVYVGAISSDYVGSNIPTKSSADLTANDGTVTAPIGYYSSVATYAFPNATVADPTLILNSVSATVRGWADYTSGYLSAGGTSTVVLQLSSRAGATITPTEASQLAVSSGYFTTGSVYVGAISSNYVGSNIPKKSSADLIGAVGTTSYTVTAPAGYYSANATKNIAKYDIATPAISLNNMTGVITATVSQANAGYVPTGSATSTYQLSTISGSSITPTASGTWVAAPAGRYTLGNIYVQPIPSAYIIPSGTSNITSNGVYDIASYASVSVSAQGDYYTVYRSLAYGSTLRSTDTGVADWIGGLQNVLSAQFEGQRFSGNFVFSNVKSIYSRAFTRRDINAFYSVNHSFEFPSCISIYDYAFNNHQSLTTISLPQCTSIYGTYAFTSCRDLSFIELPKCTKLSSFTFMSCPNLSYASLPLVTGITWSCFAFDTSLANVYAPEVTGIANGAFTSCTNLMSGSFSKCLTVGSSAFNGCTKLSYLYLGSCSKANLYAFANCSSLSSIGGTNAFTQFEDGTMVGAGLLSISYPLLVSTRLSTFRNMKSLSFAYLPAVSSLYTQTFEGCDVLNTVILSSVSAIGGSYAFRSCYNLLSLYLLGSSAATLGAINNFTSTPLSNYTTSTGGVYGSIYVKASLYDTYIAATNWKTISARFVSMTDAQISAFLSSLG